MEFRSNVEILFAVIDNTATIIKEELECPYLEAIAETGENLFHGKILQEEISELSKKRLEKEYSSINLGRYSKEDIRKSYQLTVLKGMKEAVQVNHQMTPDAVAIFISYLVSKLTSKQHQFSILDPVIGTGNLLTTILNQNSEKEIFSNGSEIDDLLLKIAYVSANLQEHSIQLFNQDSLEPLFIDPVDIVVGDLPVGYYPNDVGALKYDLRADQGHSFAHHLFIEQGINYTKAGGYLVLLIPNSLFSSEQAPKLNTYLNEHCYVQSMLQLPLSLFKNEHSAKSILILQKKAPGVTPPKQALFVELPKFSNKPAMASITGKIDAWFDKEKR